MRHHPPSTDDPMTSKDPLRVGPQFVMILVLAALVATIVATVFPSSVLAADVRIYVERIDAMLDGGIPYVDTSFEHYPLSAIPMALTRVVGGAAYGSIHLFVFAAQMLALLALVGVGVDRIGHGLGDEAALTRWLAVTLPLLPLVLFRVDALSVLFATFALGALMDEQRRAMGFGIAGVAAKGWPGVLAPVAWWQGKRSVAIGIGGFAVVLTGLLLATEGFREGRGFEGLHVETITGSLVALVGSLGNGADLVTAAGATYVRGASWMMLLNVALGLGVLAHSRVWRLAPSPSRVPLVAALATAVLVLASPLFSAQFLLWLTPFLALAGPNRSRGFFIAASLVTIVLGARWDVFETWWLALLVVRNVLFVACAVTISQAIRVELTSQASRSSLPSVS